MEAFQLEELLMLSAVPLPVDVIDPSLTADADTSATTGVSPAPSVDGAETMQVADVPAEESSTLSDSVDDLLQEFGLSDAFDEANRDLELVFIDESTDHYQQLIDDLLAQNDEQRQLEIILLDSEQDGILQISEALQNYSEVDAIHFVSHGTPQSVKLGATWLSLENLDRFSEAIAGWSESLSAGTDLLFYGCDLAATASGQELLRQIQELTGTDIAASSDDTGASSLGGDWDLEYELGDLETDVVFSSLVQNEWLGLLATETVRDQFGSQSYGNNDGTQNWNGNWVEYDNSGGAQSASTGDVRITGGELRMVGDSGADNSVTREVDLSTAHDATLSFDAVSSGTEAGDTFSVQISDNGGSSWTVLDTLTDYNGAYSRDISSYMAADTQIRIQIESGYDGGLLGLLFVEYLYIDNVQVSYTVNEAPEITSDGGGAAAVVNVAENSTAVTTVTATDGNLDTPSYAISGGADAGRFTIDDVTGELAFISAPDYESPTDNNTDNIYEVIVEASDGFGGSDTQTILVTVTPVNETPAAADNTVTTSEDTPYTFTAADFNFSDIDGDTLASVRITALETVGALQLSGVDVTLNQVVSRADIDAGNLTFTPVANANGSSYDSFTFTVNDGALESSPSNTMTVDVTAVNDAPTAADNTVTTSEDTPYTFTAADFNYSDIEGSPLASVRITALEIVGSLQLSGVDVTLNQVISRADIDAGNLTFTPVANASGTGYDSFGFTVNDGTLDSTPSNTMTVDVTVVNDAPTAADNTVSTSEDTAYTFSAVDFNFSDIEGDSLASVQITSLETVGALQLSGMDVTLNQVISRADIDAGNLTYTPVANANGAGYASFGFSVNDGTADSVSSYAMTVDVTPVNDAPTAADNTVTTNEDTAYVFTAADFNFSDIDGDTLASVRITTLETLGALQLSGVDVTLNQVVSRADIDAGNLTFMPAANASGTSYDSFGFTVNDGTADSVTAFTLTVDVSAVNDAPTAADNTVTTSEDVTYIFTATDFNFSDIEGDLLANVQISTLESVGALRLSGVDVTLNQVISRADIDAGNLTFSPVANANGVSYDSFGFRVNDGTVNSVASYTMTIDVTPVNDGPQAANRTVTTSEDTPYTFTAADFNFSDIDGDSLASVRITALESVGDLQLSGVDVTLNQVISRADIDAGNLTFTPGANASGVGYDNFEFRVNDGTLESASAYLMTVDVNGINDAPVATDNTITVSEDTTYTFTAADFNFSDIDGDTLASVRITTLETVGALQLSGVDVALNQVISRADIDAGNLTFTPVANASGSGYDSFGFSVNDGTTDSVATYTMSVDVTSVNDLPTAADNTVTTAEDITYVFTAADFNFNDIDGDTLASVRITTLESVGTLQLSGVDVTLNQIVSRADIDAGNLTFTPAANANGTSYDSFGFTVNDGTADSAAVYTMTVDVTSVNDLPTAADNTVATNEDTPYVFNAADFNFNDVDGDSLVSVRLTSLESVGTLQLSGVDVTLHQVISRADINAGNLTFTPIANASGSGYDSFGFSVNDGTVDSAVSYTMTVDVTPVNDLPTAANNTVSTNEDTPYVFTAADFNFSDIDGDSLASVRITSLESVGALQLSGVDVTLNQVISRADIDAGNLIFTPVANASGVSYDSFGFTVNDGTADSVAAYTMTVDVTSVNDLPTAADNTVSTSEDTAYTFTAADFNFSDADGDTLTSIQITSLESVGALQLSGVDVTLNQVISRADIDAGNLTFTPVANASGVAYDSFTFTVNDGTVDSAGGYTLTVDVTPVNDAPTGADNTVTTGENTVYTFTAADFGFGDIDGDALASVQITSLETVGALQLAGVDVTLNQIVSKADLDAGNLTFTPVADTSGAAYDSFGFTVNDGTIDSVATYTMTVDITPDPGYMILDQFGTQSYSNNDGTVNWSSNWVESDSSGGAQSPSNGDVRVMGGTLRMVGESGADNSATREADLSMAHDATLSFDAVSSGTESNDSFLVQISDNGGSSWTVLDVLTDFTGSYSRDISAWTAADTQIRIQIDSGYDGGLLGILFVEYLYVDNVQISYTINNPPVITSDGGGPAAVANVAENTTAVTTVAASDPDLDSMNYSISGGTDAALFTIDNLTGELAFISPPDYESPIDANTDNVYEVTVSASDGYGGSDSQTMLITVTPVNEPPTAADNTVTTAEETPYTFTAADFNFIDGDGDSLASVTITSLESVGTLQLSGVDVSLNQVISRADIDAGNLTFTPGLNASGTGYDSFGYSVNDGTFESTGTYTLTVNVSPVNDAPTSTDNTVTTSEDVPYVFTVADFNFSDIDGDSLASVRITALETVGTLQLSGVNVTLNQVINRADIDAGNLTFTPVTNASETGYDSFGFSVGDGTLYSSPASTMTINVNAVNDAPTAADNTVTTNEDTPYIFTAADFNFSDVDGDPLTSVRITSLVTSGALQLSGGDVTLNQAISRADIDAGNLVLVPAANANGTSYASFTFSVSDGALESTPGNVLTVDVTPVNDAPTAADNTVTTSEDTAYVFTAADFNFSDIDGDSLASVRINALATLGTLQLSGLDVTLNQVISRADIDAGNLTFVPVTDANGVGYASFGFVVSDGALEALVPGTLTVNVTAVNDAPTALDNTVTTDEDTPYTFTAADFNFSDIDGDPLVGIRISTLPAVGILQLSGLDVILGQIISRADIDAGDLTYVPVENGNGVAYASFDYVVSDGSLEALTSSTMTVDVTAVNDAPVITSSGGGLSATLRLSGVLSTVATIEATDVELGLQILTFSVSGGLNADLFHIDANTGELSFAASAELDSPLGGNIFEVEVQVSDDLGGTATQILTVIVDQVNQLFPSNPDQPDDPGNSDDPSQPDPPDDTTDTGGAGDGSGSGTGNEDIIFSELPAGEGDLFAERGRETQIDSSVSFSNGSPVDTGTPGGILPDFSVVTSTSNLVTDFGYEAGGWHTTRMALLQASFDPVTHRLEVNTASVVYSELVSTRYEDIQEQVNLTADSEQRLISAAAVVTTTVSSGLLIWLLQGGYLMAGLASSLPTWRFMDPIAVLDQFGEDCEEEGDSLQSIIEQAEASAPVNESELL
ncbi:MAG: Ig-like domain-containing protein [Gimesia chilikensis]|uniref:Ig-like domain-containing protein n=1 Tax=Gimesia chilikensis TaxID=2605989 RepID=UPI00378ED769